MKKQANLKIRWNLLFHTEFTFSSQLLVISILTLDIFRSVRFAHSHVISRLSDTSLNSFYYALKTDACDHSVWNDVTVSKAIRAVPTPLEGQPIFLSIDDTMVEKSGKHFELCSKLYDHAARNSSNYLNRVVLEHYGMIVDE